MTELSLREQQLKILMKALKIKDHDNSFILFTITLPLGLLSKSACLSLLITRMKTDRNLKKTRHQRLRVREEECSSLSTCLQKAIFLPFIKQFSL